MVHIARFDQVSERELQQFRREMTTPSLAWLIPVGGGWDTESLQALGEALNNPDDSLYWLATAIHGEEQKCVDFDLGRHGSRIGGEPTGGELLVVSSAFPVPGWGLLLDATSVHQAVDVVREAFASLREGELNGTLKRFADAVGGTEWRPPPPARCAHRAQARQADDKKLEKQRAALAGIKQVALLASSPEALGTVILAIKGAEQTAIKAALDAAQVSDSSTRHLAYHVNRAQTDGGEDWQSLLTSRLDAQVAEKQSHVDALLASTTHVETPSQIAEKLRRVSTLQDEVAVPWLIALEKVAAASGVSHVQCTWNDSLAVAKRIEHAGLLCVGAIADFMRERRLPRLANRDNLADLAPAPAGMLMDCISVCEGNDSSLGRRGAVEQLVGEVRAFEIYRFLGESEHSAPVARLLEVWGWPALEERSKFPLAAWLVRAGSHGGHLRDNLATPLRKSLENLARDLIDVGTAELNSEYDQVDPAERWNDETGRIILRSRLEGAFGNSEERRSTVNKVMDDFKELQAKTSTEMHDNPQAPLIDLGTVVTVAKRLLSQCIELVGELPWHVHVQSAQGPGPYLLKGTGWSHGASTTAIKSFDANALVLEQVVTYWNRSGTNPHAVLPLIIDGARL